MFLFGNKIGTWPTIMDLLYSPNLNNFAKAIHNVFFGSPLYSRGIGLEWKTHLMFMKVKLDGNSNKPNKGIYTINVYPWQFFHLHSHIKIWIPCAFHFRLHNRMLVTPIRTPHMKKFPLMQHLWSLVMFQHLHLEWWVSLRF
jgi:hypothetical protein